MSERYDAIIIGTGQAGPSLAGRLDEAGLRVAIIERHLVGGTCVNAGCVPTKALVASARAAHIANSGAVYGFATPGGVEIDMKRVKARMKKISGESNRGVTEWLGGMEHVRLLRGHARFEGPRSVRVGDQLLESDRIFLNVGARPSVPDLPGVDEVEFLTSSGMLELDFVPRHLAIVGGSYIGLEFGQIFRRFGSEVTIVERGPRLIGREDPDVSETIREMLEAEGVNVRLDAECIRLGGHADGVALGVDCAAGPPELVASHVLLAVGRTPNTDDLGLEAAGVETDPRGYVVVDDRLATNVAGIWALGDCNGRGAFTHTSYNDFEIAAANLLDDDPRRVSDRIVCYGLFVDPPLGRVGMTEQQARESGRKVLVGRRKMKAVGRAREFSETTGFMKVLVDGESQEILGAAILGLSGDEVVHALLDVMYAGAPYTTISRAVHIHPTVSELVPTTLQDLEPLD